MFANINRLKDYKNMRVMSLLVVSAALFVFSPAYAQQLDNVYGDWSVFTIKQSNKKVCYIASAPKKKTGNYRKRDEPYVLITHIKGNVDEASTSSGYPYKKGSEVNFSIGRKKYKLFTKGELAWAYDTAEDATIVKSLKKGMKLMVKGTSLKGTYSNDTYSLKGFTKAYNRMKALCK